MLFRNYEISIRFYEILIRIYEILIRFYEMLFRNYEILFRYYEILIRKNEMLFRNYEILIRFYKILFKVILSLIKNLLISQMDHLHALINFAIISRMVRKLLYLSEQGFCVRSHSLSKMVFFPIVKYMFLSAMF
jgi:hypothetical protein